MSEEMKKRKLGKGSGGAHTGYECGLECKGKGGSVVSGTTQPSGRSRRKEASI